MYGSTSWRKKWKNEQDLLHVPSQVTSSKGTFAYMGIASSTIHLTFLDHSWGRCSWLLTLQMARNVGDEYHDSSQDSYCFGGGFCSL